MLVSLVVARALNIFPICAAINLFRPPGHRISHKHMFMQWFSGLIRGPMAFALALEASENLGERGMVMKTAIL